MSSGEEGKADGTLLARPYASLGHRKHDILDGHRFERRQFHAFPAGH
jgi:hypothetical protein